MGPGAGPRGVTAGYRGGRRAERDERRRRECDRRAGRGSGPEPGPGPLTLAGGRRAGLASGELPAVPGRPDSRGREGEVLEGPGKGSGDPLRGVRPYQGRTLGPMGVRAVAAGARAMTGGRRPGPRGVAAGSRVLRERRNSEGSGRRCGGPDPVEETEP